MLKRPVLSLGLRLCGNLQTARSWRHCRCHNVSYATAAGSPDQAQKPREVYGATGQFRSVVDLAKHLEENVLFYERQNPKTQGLMVLNKPYGLPIKKVEGHHDPGSPASVSLEEALPLLAESMKIKRELKVLKSCGRFVSGPMLLCSGGESQMQRLTNLRKRRSVLGAFHEKYLAITDGVPTHDQREECADMRLEKAGYQKTNFRGQQSVEPVIRRDLFNTSAVRKSRIKPDSREIKRFSVRTETLSKSEGGMAALVSVEPTTTAWNLILVYMTEMLSPVLGDRMFNYRVRKVLGRRVKVNHGASPSGYDASIQKLPHWFVERLGLKGVSDAEGLLPTHLHLFRTAIIDFYGPGKDLVVHAPPPPYFDLTAKSFGLNLDYEELKLNDSINYKSVKHKTAAKNRLQQIEESAKNSNTTDHPRDSENHRKKSVGKIVGTFVD